MVHCAIFIVATALGLSLGANIPGNPDNSYNAEDDLRLISNSCEENDWDKPQYCRCPPGERLSTFKSKHDNGKEDRKWSLACSAITADRPFDADADVFESSENNWDSFHSWYGMASNSFLVGMESYHSNKKEDRKYTFFHTRSDDWVLSECTSAWVNGWDEDINVVLDSNKVIAGVASYHDNGKEDRRFYLVVCTLSPRCSVLKEVIYDWDNAEHSTETVVAAQTTKDNLAHPNAGTITTTISSTSQKTLGSSYTYSKTSGHEMTASLEVSAGYTWGLGKNEGSIEITAGFSSTWSTEETWERTQSMEMSEDNGFQVEFQDTCPGNSHCVLQVTANKGTARIPYQIIAYTKANPSEECVEYGTLSVQNSWNIVSRVITSDTAPSN